MDDVARPKQMARPDGLDFFFFLFLVAESLTHSVTSLRLWRFFLHSSLFFCTSFDHYFSLLLYSILVFFSVLVLPAPECSRSRPPQSGNPVPKESLSNLLSPVASNLHSIDDRSPGHFGPSNS